MWNSRLLYSIAQYLNRYYKSLWVTEATLWHLSLGICLMDTLGSDITVHLCTFIAGASIYRCRNLSPPPELPPELWYC